MFVLFGEEKKGLFIGLWSLEFISNFSLFSFIYWYIGKESGSLER